MGFNTDHTVALLDDHEFVRHALASSLTATDGLRVMGSFGSGRELIAALAKCGVDVVLVDFMLGPSEIDGINLIRALSVRFPGIKVLVMSAHYSPATVSLSLQAGAAGFIGKRQPLEELLGAIRTVAAGRTYLHPDMEIALKVYRGHEGTTPVPASPPAPGAVVPGDGIHLLADHKLSAREQEVIRCFLAGLSVNEIATKFARSANTISTQKKSAFRKLGIKNNNELFRIQNLMDNV